MISGNCPSYQGLGITPGRRNRSGARIVQFPDIAARQRQMNSGDEALQLLQRRRARNRRGHARPGDQPRQRALAGVLRVPRRDAVERPEGPQAACSFRYFSHAASAAPCRRDLPSNGTFPRRIRSRDSSTRPHRADRRAPPAPVGLISGTVVQVVLRLQHLIFRAAHADGKAPAPPRRARRCSSTRQSPAPCPPRSAADTRRASRQAALRCRRRGKVDVDGIGLQAPQRIFDGCLNVRGREPLALRMLRH